MDSQCDASAIHWNWPCVPGVMIPTEGLPPRSGAANATRGESWAYDMTQNSPKRLDWYGILAGAFTKSGF